MHTEQQAADAKKTFAAKDKTDNPVANLEANKKAIAAAQQFAAHAKKLGEAIKSNYENTFDKNKLVVDARQPVISVKTLPSKLYKQVNMTYEKVDVEYRACRSLADEVQAIAESVQKVMDQAEDCAITPPDPGKVLSKIKSFAADMKTVNLQTGLRKLKAGTETVQKVISVDKDAETKRMTWTLLEKNNEMVMAKQEAMIAKVKRVEAWLESSTTPITDPAAHKLANALADSVQAQVGAISESQKLIVEMKKQHKAAETHLEKLMAGAA